MNFGYKQRKSKDPYATTGEVKKKGGSISLLTLVKVKPRFHLHGIPPIEKVKQPARQAGNMLGITCSLYKNMYTKSQVLFFHLYVHATKTDFTQGARSSVVLNSKKVKNRETRQNARDQFETVTCITYNYMRVVGGIGFEPITFRI